MNQLNYNLKLVLLATIKGYRGNLQVQYDYTAQSKIYQAKMSYKIQLSELRIQFLITSSICSSFSLNSKVF